MSSLRILTGLVVLTTITGCTDIANVTLLEFPARGDVLAWNDGKQHPIALAPNGTQARRSISAAASSKSIRVVAWRNGTVDVFQQLTMSQGVATHCRSLGDVSALGVSTDGKRIAIVVWDVDEEGVNRNRVLITDDELSVLKRLEVPDRIHNLPITNVSWSLDSKQVAISTGESRPPRCVILNASSDSTLHSSDDRCYDLRNVYFVSEGQIVANSKGGLGLFAVKPTGTELIRWIIGGGGPVASLPQEGLFAASHTAVGFYIMTGSQRVFVYSIETLMPRQIADEATIGSTFSLVGRASSRVNTDQAIALR